MSACRADVVRELYFGSAPVYDDVDDDERVGYGSAGIRGHVTVGNSRLKINSNSL